MEPSLDHWTIIFLAIAFLGLFLSLLLFIQKKGSIVANRLLGGLILLFSVSLFYYVAYWTRYHLVIPRAFGLILTFPTLFGPLIYLYLRKISGSDLSRKSLLHFVPFIIHFLFVIIFQLLPKEQSGNGWQNNNYIILFPVIFHNIHLLIYSIVVFARVNKLIYKFRQNQQRQWLKCIAFFFAGFVISFMSYYILVHTIDFKVEYDYLISAFMSLFIFMVGYTGYLKPELLSGYNIQHQTEAKYKKSSLSPEDASRQIKSLKQLMVIHKPYLENDLKLGDLAQRLSISNHHLSQIINEHLHQNFSEFINYYRIKEAQELIMKNKEAKIIGVAYDVGFNTKASFNSAFKKFTGTSPSIFRDQVHPPSKLGPGLKKEKNHGGLRDPF